ncbi:sensor histidine kinase [Flavobacterium sp.]|uniref:sensor histidine kinase n=1 Tax=Flavobacterium sp. TaxID=239 RepID=UPI003750B3F0
MFEEIRNKYLYNKTQIIVLNKQGLVIDSDDIIYQITPQTSIADFHPFFETILSLIDLNEKEYTFSCIHLDINSKKTSLDIIFNSGSNDLNPFLIFIDFTKHYNNFQSIAQEKNESVLSFHLSDLKNQQLESEKNFKNKFLANVTHDIRTPISASLWFLGMLEKSEINAHQKELIDLLKETNIHIKELVDDILDLSKIEKGLIEIEQKPFDLKSTLDQIEKLISHKAVTKGIDFKLEIDENLPRNIIGDKKRFIQIIINLLDNSVKFTKEGTVLLSVTRDKVIKNNSILMIKVSDTGTGIKSNFKEEVFQSFKKLHNSKKIEGLGLGLSIVSNLVQLMNGKIDYTSIVNVGTTFVIELPLQIKK